MHESVSLSLSCFHPPPHPPWGGTYVTRYGGHFWPIVQPQRIEEGDCGAVGGMKIGRGNRSTLFPGAPTLKHRASVKRFVSLQFLNPKTVGRTLWTGDQPVRRPIPTQDNTNTE
jgi:hypothetical protein